MRLLSSWVDENAREHGIAASGRFGSISVGRDRQKTVDSVEKVGLPKLLEY
jgi:hypothetical protein